MKIIIALLGAILAALLLGPIAGFVVLITIAAFFIPDIGSIIAGIIVLSALAYFFGKQAVFIGVPVVMLLLYLYTLYEKHTLTKKSNNLTSSKY